MSEVKCEVITGNMLEVLETYRGKFDFVFADPPFNIGHPYLGYSDNLPEADYRTLLALWSLECWKSLNATGILALHGNDYMAEQYLRIAGCQGWKRLAWVNWMYNFGQHRTTNWVDARCHCLIFAKHPELHTWNVDDVLVESVRKKRGDKRIETSPRKGMRPPGTVWGLPSDGPGWGRVQGNNDERQGDHPNQLPEAYLRRLVLAYTDPADWVMDPFGGTGTTATVATSLGRNCVTIDVSRANTETIRRRVQKGMVER